MTQFTSRGTLFLLVPVALLSFYLWSANNLVARHPRGRRSLPISRKSPARSPIQPPRMPEQGLTHAFRSRMDHLMEAKPTPVEFWTDRYMEWHRANRENATRIAVYAGGACRVWQSRPGYSASLRLRTLNRTRISYRLALPSPSLHRAEHGVAEPVRVPPRFRLE